MADGTWQTQSAAMSPLDFWPNGLKMHGILYKVISDVIHALLQRYIWAQIYSSNMVKGFFSTM